MGTLEKAGKDNQNFYYAKDFFFNDSSPPNLSGEEQLACCLSKSIKNGTYKAVNMSCMCEIYYGIFWSDRFIHCLFSCKGENCCVK